MKHNWISGLGLFVLLLAFLAFNLLNSALFTHVRIDLTENKLFTLTEGSKQVISEIEQPIDFYFFFSAQVARDLPQLRNYAERVRSLLNEYALHAEGKIKLHFIEPLPFSEEEDQAAEYGLQAIPLNLAGDELYFGLAAINGEGEQMALPFFRSEEEVFLEYEISKLIYQLAHPQPTLVGVISGISISGGFDLQYQQPRPPWQIYTQINQLYQIRLLNNEVEEIGPEIGLLMLIQPKDLSEQALYAIDQYVLSGGKLILFIDPLAEMDQPAMPYQISEGLSKLLSSWGVVFSAEVLADAGKALMVNNAEGRPVRHLGVLGLDRENMRDDDVTSTGLESIYVSTAGILKAVEDSQNNFTPLLYSSTEAMGMVPELMQVASNPEILLQSFHPSGEVFTLAARIGGKVSSAFPEHQGKGHIASNEDVHLLVIADTDILSDRMWVEVQDFFGQQVISPFADNAGFVINALDNFSGSSALINVRSRGQFSRPFSVVEQLRRDAEEQFRDKEKQLQSRLQQTEQKLAELEQKKVEGSNVLLSPEQEQALLSFQQEKIQIRKQLRDVRHQLDRDIENLGAQLKVINIALVPLLLIISVLLYRLLRGAGGMGVKQYR